jgi:hypothetical protein
VSVLTIRPLAAVDRSQKGRYTAELQVNDPFLAAVKHDVKTT